MEQTDLPQKFLRTDLGQYVESNWTGKNECGYDPIGDNVIVLIDSIGEKIGSIHVPDDPKEKVNLAAETGVIVACGPGAFVWSQDRRRPFEGRKPIPGDHIFMERYSGRILYGTDNRTYRLVTDKQIGAIRNG